MGKLADQMAQDRALRDAARELLLADVEAVRGELDRKGIGARVSGRIGESAATLAGQTAGFATANKGAIAATLGAAAGATTLWLVRGPVMKLLHTWFSGSVRSDRPEQDSPPAERFDD